MSLFDKLKQKLSRDDDELDETATEETMHTASPSVDSETYDDSLSRMDIEAETTFDDKLLTSGQAKKVRFSYPQTARSGYSAKEVDEFMQEFVIPSLNWHEQRLHSRDMDVYKLGRALDSNREQLRQSEFASEVAESIADVNTDKELRAAIDSLEEFKAHNRALEKDNTEVREEYQRLYDEYMRLSQEQQGTPGEDSETTTFNEAQLEEAVAEAVEEQVAPYKAQIEEAQNLYDTLHHQHQQLQEENSRLRELEEQTAAQPEITETQLQESLAQQATGFEERIRELQVALQEQQEATTQALASQPVESSPQTEQQLAEVTEQYNSLYSQYGELYTMYTELAERFSTQQDGTNAESAVEQPAEKEAEPEDPAKKWGIKQSDLPAGISLDDL